ncbi:DUF7010 family protein [Salibacterium aidingense]|uniref:DUF7010 family protein n=1 Tax=Salibacterium aidingense TaxID=384933 RepID=UPI0003F6040B|nr:hypothetical protein [Salibacterium aidingense]
MMEILELKKALSVRGKNGLPFLLSACVIWAGITVLFLLPLAIDTKNIFMLFATGLMFPIALILSKWTKSEWKMEDHPLSSLGLYLNLAQFMYFPIIFWAFVQSPHHMVVFFAVITGAHFFPYGWFYQAKAYFVMAPLISITLMLLGWTTDGSHAWLIPLTMLLFLVFLNFWLLVDYRKKIKM